MDWGTGAWLKPWFLTHFQGVSPQSFIKFGQVVLAQLCTQDFGTTDDLCDLSDLDIQDSVMLPVLSVW